MTENASPSQTLEQFVAMVDNLERHDWDPNQKIYAKSSIYTDLSAEEKLALFQKIAKIDPPEPPSEALLSSSETQRAFEMFKEQPQLAMAFTADYVKSLEETHSKGAEVTTAAPVVPSQTLEQFMDKVDNLDRTDWGNKQGENKSGTYTHLTKEQGLSAFQEIAGINPPESPEDALKSGSKTQAAFENFVAHPDQAIAATQAYKQHQTEQKEEQERAAEDGIRTKNNAAITQLLDEHSASAGDLQQRTNELAEKLGIPINQDGVSVKLRASSMDEGAILIDTKGLSEEQAARLVEEINRLSGENDAKDRGGSRMTGISHSIEVRADQLDKALDALEKEPQHKTVEQELPTKVVELEPRFIPKDHVGAAMVEDQYVVGDDNKTRPTTLEPIIAPLAAQQESTITTRGVSAHSEDTLPASAGSSLFADAPVFMADKTGQYEIKPQATCPAPEQPEVYPRHDVGATVAVQEAMRRLGVDLGETGPRHNGVDGDWGPKTQAAFESACQKFDVNPSSVDFMAAPPNGETQKFLEKIGEAVGQQHDKISQLQTDLVQVMKLNLGTTGPNHDGVDGDLGPLTKKAVETVCKQAGIDPSKVNLGALDEPSPETAKLLKYISETKQKQQELEVFAKEKPNLTYAEVGGAVDFGNFTPSAVRDCRSAVASAGRGC